jgi:nucleotide-binding universal stress UspA family protein
MEDKIARFQPQLVLCPTDFSEMATLALKFAKMVSTGFEARMIVLFADHFEPPPYFTPGQENRLIKSMERSRKAATVHLARYIRENLGEETQAEALVMEDRPDQAILKTTEARNADLIVMGTHGRRGWRRFMLGSVTERTLRETDRPVLTVRFKESERVTAPVFIKKILCPVNYTEAAHFSLDHAVAMAECFRADLTVLHVIESPSSDESEQAAHKTLCTWIPGEMRSRCNLREIIRRGEPAEQIIETALSLGCDLIVIGAQHKRFSDTTVIGTTTFPVTQHTPCPVLITIGKGK